jgi:hypothetical protein
MRLFGVTTHKLEAITPSPAPQTWEKESLPPVFEQLFFCLKLFFFIAEIEFFSYFRVKFFRAVRTDAMTEFSLGMLSYMDFNLFPVPVTLRIFLHEAQLGRSPLKALNRGTGILPLFYFK